MVPNYSLVNSSKMASLLHFRTEFQQFSPQQPSVAQRLHLELLSHQSIIIIEQYSIECHKTKAKPITYRLEYTANLKPG